MSEKKPTLVEQLRAVEEYSQPNTSFGGLHIRGRQRDLIEQTSESNGALGRVLGGTGSIQTELCAAIGALRWNYENPNRLLRNPDWDSWIKDTSALVGQLPRLRSEGWYHHRRNLSVGVGAGFLAAVIKAVFDIHAPGLEAGAIFIGNGLGCGYDSWVKSRALSSLDEARERLLPNAQYLDSKIEELFGR